MSTSTSTFKPSQFQIEIFRFIQLEKGSAVISAVAGSGKTTTIVEALKIIKNKSKLDIIFCAFNTHIVNELKKRTSSGITVSTMHKLGLNWIMKSESGKKPAIVTTYKSIRNYIQSKAIEELWFGEIDAQAPSVAINKQISDYGHRLAELLSFCKVNLAIKVNEISSIAIKFGLLGFTNTDFLRLEELFKVFYVHNDMSQITLDDMIFFPAYGIITPHQYDYVFVDECQDLNKAQQECIKKMMKQGGRLIAVGDPYQAIYGFAGADSESFKEITNWAGVTSLPLSDCYRCGKRIIDFAKTLVPHIQSHKDCISGTVRYGSYFELEDSDFVLCRYNAPLAALFFDLLRGNKKAYIKGGEIGEALMAQVKATGANSISEMFEKIENRLINLYNILLNKELSSKEIEEDKQYKSLKDSIEILRVIAERCNNIGELKGALLQIFADNGEGIMLSSIHKSKGLEADRVFILYDDLMPSSKAKQDWEIEQETNLMYVAYTRAKKELIFINDYEGGNIQEQMVIRKSNRFEDFLYDDHQILCNT